ncbi:uncharacterized protein LY89DRAFT_4094 [Mollisia scopiformis]|uniref:Uncharacterized protein n=1 Tax=Mollisia scopiformis TaxID=149040 RepID=A0A194XVT1_MOLSC|nr:uncharacterized protein LY89DRAFT_4094 [Mollisia scopiformis]KUJ23827.1 hypothetical protein LY89DRAFT_4094 [Mollisia scopiformis]
MTLLQKLIMLLPENFTRTFHNYRKLHNLDIESTYPAFEKTTLQHQEDMAAQMNNLQQFPNITYHTTPTRDFDRSECRAWIFEFLHHGLELSQIDAARKAMRWMYTGDRLFTYSEQQMIDVFGLIVGGGLWSRMQTERLTERFLEYAETVEKIKRNTTTIRDNVNPKTQTQMILAELFVIALFMTSVMISVGLARYQAKHPGEWNDQWWLLVFLVFGAFLLAYFLSAGPESSPLAIIVSGT